MRALGRLLDNDTAMSYAGSLPNFQTVMAPDTLFGGTAGMLLELYDPDKYFQRGLRSLEHWVPNAAQRGPRVPLSYGLRGILRSFWVQGVRSDYRRAYWRFFLQMVSRWWRDSTRLVVAVNIMVTAHHFIGHAREVAAKLHEARGNTKKRRAAGASLPVQ
jgi:predicted alpha/beta-fold hydrolase